MCSSVDLPAPRGPRSTRTSAGQIEVDAIEGADSRVAEGVFTHQSARTDQRRRDDATGDVGAHAPTSPSRHRPSPQSVAGLQSLRRCRCLCPPTTRRRSRSSRSAHPSHSSVTTDPGSREATISATRSRAPWMFVPVDGPTRRSSSPEKNRMAAIDAESGTASIRSITWETNDGSTRGRPMPSMREPTSLRSDPSPVS